MMDAIERAERDEQDGDLGSARRRLMSLIDSSGYDPEICAKIARLCALMRDPCEAGRWELISDRPSDQFSEARINQFVTSCSEDPRVVFARLPRAFKSTKAERVPPTVQARLDLIGVRELAESQKPAGVPRRAKRGDSGALLGCANLTVMLGFVLVTGLKTILTSLLR